MSAIYIGPRALAAFAASLRQEVSDAVVSDSANAGAPAAMAGLAALHAMLCCAEEEAPVYAEEERAAEEELVELASEAEAEAEAEAKPEDPPDEPDAPEPQAPDAAWTDAARAASAAEPPPRRPRGQRASTWTPERIAWMEAHYANMRDNTATLAALRELPGAAIADIQAVYLKASKMGLRRIAAPQPAAQRPVSTTLQRGASTAMDQRAQDEAEAEKLIRDDATRWHGRAIHEEFGWPLDEAGNFAARIRAKIAAERRDAAIKAAE